MESMERIRNRDNIHLFRGMGLLIWLGILCFSLFYVPGVLSQEVKSPKPQIVGEELKHRIVRIEAYFGMDKLRGLEPNKVISSKGTTVIWLNSTYRPVTISFEGGDKVQLSCTEPKLFTLGSDGTYNSETIPFGGTASLCFIEEGEFKYKVRVEPPTPLAKPLEGTIIIR